MSSIHWIQSQCGAYILGKTILICVKNNSCFNTEAVYICRSIKAVGGAVVMVSAATLHQIVTPELSSVHHPPMSWSLAADDNSPGPRVTSGAWMIIILAIDLQISPQTIRSLQNNFLSELFWWISPPHSLLVKIAQQREHSTHHITFNTHYTNTHVKS